MGVVLMEDALLLMLAYEPDDQEKEKVAELNELLKDFGVSFKLQQTGRNKDNSIVIYYDTEKMEQKKKRNAGAKRKYLGYHEAAAIRERMKMESADQIAQDLGIGRATLFRRLKKAEEMGKNQPI